MKNASFEFNYCFVCNGKNFHANFNNMQYIKFKYKNEKNEFLLFKMNSKHHLPNDNEMISQ